MPSGQLETNHFLFSSDFLILEIMSHINILYTHVILSIDIPLTSYRRIDIFISLKRLFNILI